MQKTVQTLKQNILQSIAAKEELLQPDEQLGIFAEAVEKVLSCYQHFHLKSPIY